MINEYLINLIAEDREGNYLEGSYPFTRTYWGVDEYDAFTGFLREYIGNLDEENFNIHLSKVTSTGRTKVDLLSMEVTEACKNIDSNTIEFENLKNQEELSDYIASKLKTFGFRVDKKDDYYMVRIPSIFITDAIIEYFDDRQVYKLNSLDLVLLWNNVVSNWTNNKDREYYGLDDNNYMVLLGETEDAEKENDIYSAFHIKGIKPFLLDSGCDCKVVAVPLNKIKLAQSTLSSICNNLINEYNFYKYFNRAFNY